MKTRYDADPNPVIRADFAGKSGLEMGGAANSRTFITIPDRDFRTGPEYHLTLSISLEGFLVGRVVFAFLKKSGTRVYRPPEVA